MTVGLMAEGESLPRGELVAGAVLVLWALLDLGGIFDHRRWALPSELLRLPVTAAAAGLQAARRPMAHARSDRPWRWRWWHRGSACWPIAASSTARRNRPAA